jgi:large conductance mechanosensitive channel
LLKEFREFAMKGSVVDLAVGLILGTAFGAIVKSLVDDILMPIVGIIGGMDFSDYAYVIKQGTLNAEGQLVGEVAIKYGQFANFVLTFLIVAFCMFMLVKAMNQLKRKQEAEPAPPPEPPPQEMLLTEIRDLLAKRA